MDELKKIAKESGSDEILWPGDGLKKANEVVKGPQSGEQTKIPEIRNDGKKYNGDKQT